MSLARQPSFSKCLEDVNPGVPRSTTNAVMPRCLGTSGFVRARTTQNPPIEPCVMNVLVPFEDPLVALSTRAREQGRRVASASGFGEGPGRQPLARSGARKVLALLRLGTEGQDVARTQTVVGRDRQRDGAVDTRDLLDADRVARRVHARAAVLLGNADAEEAHLRELRHEGGGKPLLLVPALRLGRDLGTSEVANALA